MNIFDIIFIAAVSLQGTFIAYVYSPRWKSLILTMPVAFTLGTLSLGVPVESTHVLGLVFLFFFSQAVRFLHYRWKTPIVICIGTSALGYCMAGWGAALVLPTDGWIFWIIAISVFICGNLLFHLMHPPKEIGQKSALPVWLKFIIISSIVLLMVILKNNLKGFMTVFPYNGVIASYEARRSLGTISRQITVIMSCFSAMMMTVRVLQPVLPMIPSLAASWFVFFFVLSFFLLRQHRERKSKP